MPQVNLAVPMSNGFAGVFLMAVGLLCAIAMAEPPTTSFVQGELKQLATGLQFTEGPVWTNADGGYLLFSDIPAAKIMKWTPAAGLSVYREKSNQTNGNTRDREGRLISCEHASRQVTRTEKDG